MCVFVSVSMYVCEHVCVYICKQCLCLLLRLFVVYVFIVD